MIMFAKIMLKFVNILKPIFGNKITHGLIVAKGRLCIQIICVIFMMNRHRISRPNDRCRDYWVIIDILIFLTVHFHSSNSRHFSLYNRRE